MKTADFLGIKTGKLALGGNPFHGHSYITDTVSRDAMLDYYTAERVIGVWKYAQTLGYTAFITTTDDFSRRCIRQFRNEGGGMQWIAQTSSSLDIRASVNNAIEGNAVAIFHQGTSLDSMLENGQLDTIRKNLDEMRRAGIPIGIATHVPGHIAISETAFDVDFYMASLHNLRKNNENRISSSISGLKWETFSFDAEDRVEMLGVIKALDKPCIAYKILAGGNYAFDRESLKNCFIETYKGIKPNDIATAGVFQRDHDQLKENILMLDEVLSELEQ